MIIPVYNRAELLQRTLAALSHQTFDGDWDVIVVDDGSDEDISAAVRQISDATTLKTTLVSQPRDGYGAGRARNLGAATATGEILVFIDADCMPHPELIVHHVSWHIRATNLVVIGSRHHLDTSSLSVKTLLAEGVPLAIPSGGSDDFRHTFHRRSTNLRFGDEAFRSLVSSNFSVRATTFGAVGGFDETFRRWGGEDTELGWRLSEAGAFIIPEDNAAMFHQTQIDGEQGWREASRAENESQITTRIPHRFYRKPVNGRIFFRPKVTWIIAPVVDGHLDRIWEALGRQSFSDFESIWVGESLALAEFLEVNRADPRIKSSSTIDDAISMARGQYVATLHGWATPDHRLAGRLVRRFDNRPRLAVGTVGYQTPGPQGPRSFGTETDVTALNDAWSASALPPFTWIRRREWSKAMLDGSPATEAYRSILAWSEAVHFPDPLVALPGAMPTQDMVSDYPAYQSDRSKLLEDLQARPAKAIPTLGRYTRARLTHTPFQTPPTDTKLPRIEPADRTQIRYVGWVGKENFGDEVMFNAVSDLMDWADVRTSGETAGLLLLGGGTLINRGGYLSWLQSKDSPRTERAVFGTGVANPSYWGITEPIDQWLDFLSTCAYIGVRGPMSAEILSEWGFKGTVEVVGDPALLVRRPLDASPTDPAVVTISPARTGGELWGKSDEAVFASLADLTRRLVDEGRDVRFLSCFPADDRPIFEIMRAAGHPNLPYLAGYADLPGAIHLLAESSLVISERLHGAVLAAACGTPFIGLEYRPKVRDFARSVNMERFVMATNELGGLREIVGDLESNLSTVLPSMDTAVEGYRQRLTAAAETIRQASI